jgi:hypothetical protein
MNQDSCCKKKMVVHVSTDDVWWCGVPFHTPEQLNWSTSPATLTPLDSPHSCSRACCSTVLAEFAALFYWVQFKWFKRPWGALLRSGARKSTVECDKLWHFNELSSLNNQCAKFQNNIMPISVFKRMLKMWSKLYFFICCVSFLGEYIW